MSAPIPDIKQVILYRRDLKMRKGKIAAQVAHASLQAILDLGESTEADPNTLVLRLDAVTSHWIRGHYKKIVLSVEGEEALLQAHELARGLGIPCALITDAGRTEFHGQPTRTALALGPAPAALIDPISGPEGCVTTKLA